MTLLQIAPELRKAARLIPALPIGSRMGRWFMRTLFKIGLSDRQYEGVTIEKRPVGNNMVRVYIPHKRTSDSALLWIHGGGFVIGGAIQDDRLCVSTAKKLGIIIVSVEYRLSPESSFPAALDDCLAAWKWLQQSAPSLKVNIHKVAIGGQSAGGGLAASLVQRVHDVEEIQPIAQWIFSPMLDDLTATDHRLDAIKHTVWNNKQNYVGWKSYLGTEPGTGHLAEYAVPAHRANLEYFPPTWIGAGDIELFFDEDIKYAKRLEQSGCKVAIEVVPGAFHGFESLAWNTQFVQTYIAKSQAWLRKELL